MKSMFLLFCCCSLLATAQKLKTSIDKLTGDTIFYTKGYNLFPSRINSSGVGFQLQKHKDEKLFILSTHIGSFLPEVKEGEELNFKLSSGKIITSHARAHFRSVPDEDLAKPAAVRNFYMSPEYKLDETTISELKQGAVVLIRFHYDATFKDYEFMPEDTEILKKAIQLMFP